MKTALTTQELGLRPAVALVGIATAVTPLGGMPGVYSDNLAAKSLSLVLKESLELGEAPGVEPVRIDWLSKTSSGREIRPEIRYNWS